MTRLYSGTLVIENIKSEVLTAGFEPTHANIPGPKPGSLDHSDKSTCWIYYFCLLSDLNRRGAFAHQVLNPTRSARLREIGNM